MTDLTETDVKAILKLFEDSNFDYLEFEDGDLKLAVAKNGYVPVRASHDTTDQIHFSESKKVQDAAKNEPVSDLIVKEVNHDVAPRQEKKVTGLIAIKAPLVGTFYAAPDPQSEPFVTVGKTVEKGVTIGLIEVMKVYTSVQSEIAGEVVEILVSDTDTVQQSDVLFYLKPLN